MNGPRHRGWKPGPSFPIDVGLARGRLDYRADFPLRGFAGKFVYSAKDSIYTDADYVVITDFGPDDQIALDGPVSNYWIGAAPGKTGLAANNVSPRFTRTDNFGIYQSSGPAGDGPNLVAEVRMTGYSDPNGFSLNPNDLSTSNQAFTPNLAEISATEAYLGWGRFYSLDGSSIASNITTV